MRSARSVSFLHDKSFGAHVEGAMVGSMHVRGDSNRIRHPFAESHFLGVILSHKIFQTLEVACFHTHVRGERPNRARPATCSSHRPKRVEPTPNREGRRPTTLMRM